MKSRQQGLSLVELMIAITLGLVLSAAVIQVFLASRSSYRVQESLSLIQESARFAMDYIGREVRMAGYMGCNSTGGITPNVIAKPPADAEFQAVEGVDNVASGNALGALPGTDVLNIRRSSSQAIRLTGNLTPNNANVQVEDNSLGFIQGDFVLISDCASADIFRITNSPKESGKGQTTLTHASNSNTSNKLSKIYGADAEVFGFVASTFFVRDTGRTTGGGNAVTSLYFRDRPIASGGVTSAATELVEGVENLQLAYGIDDDGDRSVDRYAGAASVTDWEEVLSVRVELTMVAMDEGVVGTTGSDNAQTVYDSAGNLINNADGRMRQVFTSVFALRNRLP